MQPFSSWFKRLFAPAATRRTAHTLYARIVAQARSPALYERYGVPDTLDGRFDMIVLHLYLVLLTLRRAGGDKRLQVALQETMIADFDRSLREMGVGDLSVGRKVKEMASACFGRLNAYEDAMAKGKSALSEALGRNVWRQTGMEGDRNMRLAAYMKAQDAALGAQTPDKLLTGEIEFVNPALPESAVDE